VVATVVVVVLGGVTWLAAVNRKSHSAEKTGVRLLVASSAAPARVGIFTLDGGTVSAVRGIPAGGCPVGNVFRIQGTEKWALTSQQPNSGSQPCDSAAGGIYVVDAVALTARWIGSAQGIAAADRSSLWTVSGVDLQPAQELVGYEIVQRVSLTGAALSPVYALPVGWAVIKGLTPDLLLLARDQGAGSDNYEAWQPSTGRVLGQYERVFAANASVVVWVNTACAPDNCPVHLSAPASGTDRTVSLPAGAYAYDGSLSDDGTYLALSLGTAADTQGATDQDSGVIVEMASRVVHLIPQTKVPASETGSLSLNWAARGWLLVSTPGPNATSQLAAYNPTTGAFVVAQHIPPTDEYAVV